MILLQKNFIHYLHKPNVSLSLSGNDVRCIFEDTEGTIWFGTQGAGLCKWKGKGNNFICYTTRDGLPDNSINGILQADDGFLWITSNQGICKFNANKKQCIKYTVNDGLQSNEFTSGAFMKGKSGLIYAGGSYGFNVFNSNTNENKSVTSPLFITSFQIYNKAVGPKTDKRFKKNILYTDTIIISWEEKIFSIGFVSLNYINPNRDRIRYMLENFNHVWTEASDRKEVTYTNLAPGKYIFRVVQLSTIDNQKLAEDSLVIIISPPFWNTWWFQLILISSILATAFLLIRLRIKQLKSQQVLLEKQVKVKTSEISEQKEELQNLAESLQKKNKILIEQQEEIKSINEELSAQRDRILKVSDREKELNKTKIRFFTNVSHEFRTPLTLIIGPAEKLMTEIANVNHKGVMVMILRNALRLHTMINQIMDLRKLESGEMKLNISGGDLIFFIRHLSSTFNLHAEKKKIDFTFTTNNESYFTMFDKDKIETIFNNLLSNAFKFTPEGGFININFRTIIKGVEIIVSDSGIGIPEKDNERIFKSFYQSDYSQQINNQGTGIGLSLVREFVNLHNGTIHVNSKEMSGAKFHIFMPLIEDKTIQVKSNENKIQIDEAVDEMLYSEKKKTHILIIDDHEDIREFIRNSFNSDYQITEAADGRIGFELALKIVPDLVISDIMMPVMDGLEFTAKMKENQLLSHIPIVLLTARGSDEHQVEGLRTKADDYIVKPFSMQNLKAKVESILENRRMLRDKFRQQTENTPSYKFNEHIHTDLFMITLSEVIQKNISNPNFGTTELGEALNMSRTQIYRKVKVITDQVPNEIIRQARLKEGARLMIEDGLNVTEAALGAGFSNYNYFTKCFGEFFKTTPTEFITSYRK